MLDFNDKLTQKTIVKIIRMFRPAKDDFIDFPKDEVIQGPNDRSLFGCDTYFPIKWLTEDDEFTEEEARLFVNLVKELDDEDYAKSFRA